ncbi:calcium uptake protein 3, mitochondrial-like isoform X2 [Chrysoperla carnea]|uniref:calcium uptake protein 3, mitochondrial-like isoform X2 n=1 Tax=Chrysoperla carnea TaxID=189513 RepID=UPI001D05E29F|nr:calcium uptake protein 3, mitochondrial-like isoform X2 [Chrysoperla carnea]
MSTLWKLNKNVRLFVRHLKNTERLYSTKTKNVNQTYLLLAPICGSGLAVFGYWVYCKQYEKNPFVVNAARQNIDEWGPVVQLTSRERRFIRFASVEFDGQLYMTPQDFLESVIEQQPRPRLKRRILTMKEIEQFRDATPSLNKGSSHLFRDMRDNGIISYTEYLFLLSILTKPQSGFRIAFNMFDTDGNERIDKNEFLVMERIFSYAWKGKRGISGSLEEKKTERNPEKHAEQDQYVNDETGLQRRHIVDTMLTVHFFGKKGKDELRFNGFRKFMENLQTEVLELEFNEFSRGLPTISELDFAKILLRYTYLDTDEYDMYLDRLVERLNESDRISFDSFKDFCQFLNNLEDFTVAMRMYTLADRPISKDEFTRAVKLCTGTTLTPHLVDTVFAIFDVDGDGLLSYREFIAIMKDRVHRGLKSYAKAEGWDAFKACVKQEMKTPTWKH